MIKITQKIKSVSILKSEHTLAGVLHAPVLSNVVQMHEKIERNAALPGMTYKIDSPLSEESFFVTINDIILNSDTPYEQRRPYEIFINSKNMEAFQWIVALTRLCSAVFRKGGDVTFLAEELKSIFDPRGGYIAPGGRYVPSLVAEIGIVIEQHLISLGLIKHEAMSEEAKAMIAQKRIDVGDAIKNAAQCPKCNAVAYVIQSGCGTCLECAYSKCG